MQRGQSRQQKSHLLMFSEQPSLPSAGGRPGCLKSVASLKMVKIRCIAQNGSFLLGTVLLIRYGKVGRIHKYLMMVWTHQISCCKTSIRRAI
jgi:hypothetical protein